MRTRKSEWRGRGGNDTENSVQRNSQLILGYKILIRLITKLEFVMNTQCAHRNTHTHTQVVHSSCTEQAKAE